MDTSANVQNRYIYQPFGELHENNPADFDENVAACGSFRFTGQYYDSEIDQYYLRARQYYPYIGRFTSRDPVLGQLENPLTLHKYLYCRNNPINVVDPAGLAGGFLFNSVADEWIFSRDWLAWIGTNYKEAVRAGVTTAGEALADLAETVAYRSLIAGSYRNIPESKDRFIEEMQWMFTDTQGRFMERTSGNLHLMLGQSGFRKEFREGHRANQDRHFVACVVLGYYWGRTLGSFGTPVHDFLSLSLADIRLGNEGARLGALIARPTSIYYPKIFGLRVDLEEVGDWIRTHVLE